MAVFELRVSRLLRMLSGTTELGPQLVEMLLERFTLDRRRKSESCRAAKGRGCGWSWRWPSGRAAGPRRAGRGLDLSGGAPPRERPRGGARSRPQRRRQLASPAGRGAHRRSAAGAGPRLGGAEGPRASSWARAARWKRLSRNGAPHEHALGAGVVRREPPRLTRAGASARAFGRHFTIRLRSVLRIRRRSPSLPSRASAASSSGRRSVWRDRGRRSSSRTRCRVVEGDLRFSGAAARTLGSCHFRLASQMSSA